MPVPTNEVSLTTVRRTEPHDGRRPSPTSPKGSPFYFLLREQRELLHAAPGRSLTDVQVAARVDAHAVGAQELAHLAAAAAELANHFHVAAAQDPHLVVRAV